MAELLSEVTECLVPDDDFARGKYARKQAVGLVYDKFMRARRMRAMCICHVIMLHA